jgi:apyrase
MWGAGEHDTSLQHYAADKDGSWKGRSRARQGGRWPRYLLAVSVACFVFVLATPRAMLQSLLQPASAYAVVLDAGSSGTRAHVFRFQPRPGHTPRLLQKPSVLKQSPGLSAFADQPAKAARQVEELLHWAHTLVPAGQRKDTPVVLLATAGLRLLVAQRGEAAGEAVLDVCRPVLLDSQFLFRDDWAHILPGADEGAFAWVAANYAAGTLEQSGSRGDGGGGGRSVGVLELGGASAQVTYEAGADGEVGAADRKDVVLRLKGESPPVTFRLYTRSFLGLGLDAVVASASAPAAHNGGEDDPTSGLHCATFAACRAVASRLLGLGSATCDQEASERRGACLGRPDVGAARAKGGMFVPAVRGPFVALENFKHVADALALGPSATLAELGAAAEVACRTGKGAIHMTSQHSAHAPPPLCFASAFVFTLLHDALGVPLHGEQQAGAAVQFVDTVDGTPVDWPLGALVAQYGALALAPSPTSVLLRRAVGLLALATCLGCALAWATRGGGDGTRDRGAQARRTSRHKSEDHAPVGVHSAHVMKRSVSNLGL